VSKKKTSISKKRNEPGNGRGNLKREIEGSLQRGKIKYQEETRNIKGLPRKGEPRKKNTKTRGGGCSRGVRAAKDSSDSQDLESEKKMEQEGKKSLGGRVGLTQKKKGLSGGGGKHREN